MRIGVLFVFLAVRAMPQADVATAHLRGVVTDPAAAAVGMATVTATNLERGVARTVSTDEAGEYQILFLAPGTYEIRVAAPGFKTHVVSRVELTVGRIQIEDVGLRLGPVEETVVVTEAAPAMEPSRSQQANTVSERQIASLPNLSRSMTNYVFMLPGVADSAAPRAQQPGFTFESSGFSIGGSIACACANAASWAATSAFETCPSASWRCSNSSALVWMLMTSPIAAICPRKLASWTAAVTTFEVSVK